MRVRLLGEDSAFTHQLLEVGNGQVPVDADSCTIKLPEHCGTVVQSTAELIDKLFPGIATNFPNLSWIRGRAILAPKNSAVQTIRRCPESSTGNCHSIHINQQRTGPKRQRQLSNGISELSRTLRNAST